jgi:hypothetical protein
MRGGISVETQHIFPIIKKWLYSDKDIFLREIVSNASDATIKLKRLNSLGEITLNGEYVLMVSESDGQKSAALTYKYDKLNAIGESDDFISEISGTLYAKGENEVGQLKDSAIIWEGGVVPSDISPIEISADIFESFDAKDEDGVLTLEGTLKKDVLGKGISDARLTLECAEKDTRMILITLEYTDGYGARVRAVYSYFVQNLWGNK